MYEAGAGRTKIHIRSLWFLLMYSSELLDSLRSADRESIHAGLHDADLLDALAEILITDTERRMKEALSAGYRPRSQALTRVRGRVDHLATAQGRLMESGRIQCKFNELTFDRPRYRYLLGTLVQLQSHLTAQILRSRCITLCVQLERAGVTRHDPTANELSLEQYGFNDSKDRRLIQLCKLLRQFAIPEHTAGQSVLPMLKRDESALRTLFEKAVRGYYKFHLDSDQWTVSAPHLKWEAEGDESIMRFLPRHQTDVVLESLSGRRIIVECKFAPIFDLSYGQPKLKQGYLRQLYSYCATAHFHDGFQRPPEGVLLAVRTEDGLGRDLDFTLGGFRTRVRLIDLTDEISKIRYALNGVLDLPSNEKAIAVS